MFRTALTNLSALVVDGVTNYDIDAIPPKIKRGQLPALLVLPLDVDGIGAERRLFGGDREGFVAAGFSDGIRTVTYSVTHLLIVTPVASGRGWRDSVPPLIDLIDAYFGALASAVTLNGQLLEPASVRVEPGVFRYGETDYIGCAFRHTWLMAV